MTNPYNAGIGGLADAAIKRVTNEAQKGVSAIQRLYALIEVLQARLVMLKAENEQLREIAEAASVLEKCLASTIKNDEVDLSGTELGSDLVSDALNKAHRALAAWEQKP
jgi:hypothetical protein